MPTWLLITICIVCWASWGVVEKLATREATPMMIQVISAYAYSMIAPVFFLYMKATGQRTNWTTSGIVWTCLGCVLATVASLAFTTAIQKTHVHIVVGFGSTYPILTFLMCSLFLGEPVTMSKIVGIVIIALGTVLLA